PVRRAQAAGPDHRLLCDDLCGDAFALRALSRAGRAARPPVARRHHGHAAVGAAVHHRRRLRRRRAAPRTAAGRLMADAGPLETEIRRLITLAGPMPVSEFMGLCLGHPRHGYYITNDPIGSAGDFITAPEISQMFGELIGLWAA